MSESRSQGGGAFITGLLLGGLIGAAIGVWKAPRSGAELRREILSQGGQLRTRAESAVLGERPADVIAEGKALAQQRQIELASQ
jgi:gas vesicle protein